MFKRFFKERLKRRMFSSKLRRKAEYLKDGDYVLGEGARLLVRVNAIKISRDDFEELWDRMPLPTPNPMNPKGPPILRRQCSMGGEYQFAGQKSKNIGKIDENSPKIIKEIMRYLKRIVSSDIYKMYTGAHINFYKGGKAGLSYHQDNEGRLKGLPIYSFTFLADGPDYRYFCIAKDKRGKDNRICLPLRDGDLIVMEGENFQRDFWHSVPRTLAKDFINQRRINVTIRAWDGEEKIIDSR